jgi:hypothetical protein
MFFVGDTEDPSTLAAQKDLDAAFVSPWLYETARRRGHTMDAQRIVFYHQQRGETPAACDRCVTLQQNATLELQ